MITWPTKQINTREANPWATNKLLEKSSLTIVNFKYGIAC